jgi:hypothetical protein
MSYYDLQFLTLKRTDPANITPRNCLLFQRNRPKADIVKAGIKSHGQQGLLSSSADRQNFA